MEIASSPVFRGLLTFSAIVCVLGHLIIKLLTWASKKTLTESAMAESLLKKYFGHPDFKIFMQFSKCSSNIICKNGILTLDYVVPSSICTLRTSDCTATLSLEMGGILALADEVSSILVISHDKTHRPGVSVVLSGERCCDKPIVPGQTIFIEVKINRVGATVGFLEMNIFEKREHNLTRLATVRHVKYLKVGVM